MGKRKNANPRKNARGSAGVTEQLGTAAAAEDSRSPWTLRDKSQLEPLREENATKKQKVSHPEEPKKKQEELARSAAASCADPEVSIESSGVSKEDSYWKIQCLQNFSDVSYKQDWVLRSYRLLRTELLDQEGSPLLSRGFVVCTSQGAAKLLQHCETCCIDDTSDFSSVASAVEDGTLQLNCSPVIGGEASVKVTISLTELAFEATQELPLQKRATSKKYQGAYRLHQALGSLFPGTVVADVVHAESADPITAKTVYDLIDNVQLQKYEADGGYDSKPMCIPGLLPTLRPYQEAAVKWMLQREKYPRESIEWELAWTVLTPPEEVQRPEEDANRVRSAAMLSLPEYKRRKQLEVIGEAIFYCPFIGMLTKSGVNAYTVTLRSFVGGGEECEWSNPAGGILAESMGLGKTVEVLACILANPYVAPTQSEELIACKDAVDLINDRKNGIDTENFMGLDSHDKPRTLLKKWVNSFGACICGMSSSFKGCLSIVLCQSCREPMHGLCAGFTSMEHLRTETNEVTMGNYLVPLCSSDRCPTCVFTRIHKSSEPIQSRATLIITPAAILNQWEREIRRHVNLATDDSDSHLGSPGRSRASAMGIKVVVYPGVRDLCTQNSQSRSVLVGSSSEFPRIHLIHPSRLADADVVLMTYDVLMTELAHSDENPYISSSRQLRREKRYRVLPSPLSSIKWWRICLDEAQRVETPTATSAKMALKLEAHHRWCVSGTPVGRGKLDDLYGLLTFLKLGPFSNKKWFQMCLQPSHSGVKERIKHLLATVAWRSTKASESVRKQIGIPEQVERKVVLKFSSIEKHFYERQLEATLSAASDVMDKRSAGRIRKTADDLLASHLHRLRAACCHPQVGSSGIVRAKRAKKAHATAGEDSRHSVSVSSGVLTMDQILDRLIDDARVKCEEAQRLAIMHTNALASLSRLKVEANQLRISGSMDESQERVNKSKEGGDGTQDSASELQESDEFHLTQSCRGYLESLELMDENAKPSAVVGEAVLSGCKGCLVNAEIIRDGKANLEWHIRDEDAGGEHRELWTRLDFEGPSKKIVEIKVRPKVSHDDKESAASIMLMPRECAFQVSSSAVGGEFVDVVSFTLPKVGEESGKNDWLSFGSFRTNRSKSWRLVIKSYYQPEMPMHIEMQVFYVGVELQLLEADIAADSLQRLHVLHNASLSMSSLVQHYENITSRASSLVAPFMSVPSIKEKVKWMEAESRKIESLYMDAARSVHSESQRQLKHARRDREEAESELESVSIHGGIASHDCWDDAWWNDLLSMAYLYGTNHERLSICERVHRDMAEFVETLEGEKYASKAQHGGRHKSFPDFHDVDGIKAGLDLRFLDAKPENSSWSHRACMDSVSGLSSHPSHAEISANSHCEKCRADWNQTGPECSHCKLETRLNRLDEGEPVITMVLKSLYKWLVDTKTSGKFDSQRKLARLDKRAKYFFDVLKAQEKELRIARLAWRTHFDLLSDLDEMGQCKRSIRLAVEGEDLTRLTADELGSIVQAIDIPVRTMDHGAKQAMALATLRRNKDTLRYLKNQNNERLLERAAAKPVDGKATAQNDNVCIVCLSPFEGERAVLSCGHSFHYTPCLEKLMAKGGHQSICCPLRCPTRTKKDEVMIASERRRDDGSKSTRKVKGSWSTKVNRLLSDVMEVSDRAEKSIIFSQWEDMLDVVEHALNENDVDHVRVKTLRKIGDCLKKFRSSECSVLLLNVKNGAEGLTIVEATHVFMIEPLLNCGLDSQAINRIHRIGQRSKTYVHRYLIEDTIEMKIDKMRVESQDDQVEDALNESRKKHAVSGGGVDGGFSFEQLQDILH